MTWDINLFLAMVICFCSLNVNAQDIVTAEPSIRLSGKVNCVHPVNGTLASVVVFNINNGYGTISDPEGLFSIEMAKTDTIVFSTEEHNDFYYLIDAEKEFKDHWIEVMMITDDIWLDAVTIMGHQTLEQFKREILNLDIPAGNYKLALPTINKYANQLKTGDGRTDLVGSLTYLQNKFDRYYTMRKRIGQSNNTYRK